MLGVSLAVLVPVVFAACTITATLAIVYALAHEVLMVSYVANLVELIGLGLAVDYSLLVVARFREELERGGEVDEAMARAARRTGPSILASGGIVVVAMVDALRTPAERWQAAGLPKHLWLVVIRYTIGLGAVFYLVRIRPQLRATARVDELAHP